MELSLLILVYIHKSYIIYLEIYVVPIGHGFSFGHGKSMLKKRGHPVNGVLFPMFCLLEEGECQILVF